ncbi:MAG: hypothetical protein ABIQ29_10455 [Burkholderiaceae bacterium]
MSTSDTSLQKRYSPFVPMLLIALAIVVWLAFQSLQLVLEQRQLTLAQANQESQYQAATKLRAALDGVATATAKLATEGNANARVVVEELRKRGVTIRPNATP